LQVFSSIASKRQPLFYSANLMKADHSFKLQLCSSIHARCLWRRKSL